MPNVTPVEASVNAAYTRIAGKAELRHRRVNHLGYENLKLAAKMVDRLPSLVADAARVVGTVRVPRVDGKMLQAPHPRSSDQVRAGSHSHAGTSHGVTG